MSKRRQPAIDDWEPRLDNVDWSTYQTVYGPATAVKDQLWRLSFRSRQEALDAVNELWSGLCHQHVQIASATLPVLPFLLEAVPGLDDLLKVEVLDILLGLAVTSNSRRIEEYAEKHRELTHGAASAPPPWIKDVRAGLEEALPAFVALRTHSDPDIAAFSRMIVDELVSTNPAIQPSEDPDRPLLPLFEQATADFSTFLAQQGFPLNLLWVERGDLVLHPWRAKLLVRKGNPSTRLRRARREYQCAVAGNIGLCMEALCKTKWWTICRIVVPDDAEDAAYRLISNRYVKKSAAVEPLPATVIEQQWLWRIVSRFGQKASHLWE